MCVCVCVCVCVDYEASKHRLISNDGFGRRRQQTVMADLDVLPQYMPAIKHLVNK